MHPVLLTIEQFHIFSLSLGPLYIYSYGAMLALSMLAGLFLILREAKLAKLRIEDVLDCCILVLILSIVGARAMYILLTYKDYAHNPAGVFMIWQGGLSYHGGALGGFLAIAWFSWRRKLNGWQLSDIGMPALALGAAIARWGCFLNGCCYGRECHLPWAVAFPVLQDNIPRHPVQLYDFLLNVILFGLLLFLKRYKRKEGDMVGFYLMGFSVLRFITEIFRSGATGRPLFGGPLTEAQAASFLIMAVGILIYALPVNKLPGSIPYVKPGTAPAAAEAAAQKYKAKSAAKTDSKSKLQPAKQSEKTEKTEKKKKKK